MGFETEHAEWFASHIARRSGERKDRLARGHGHGEKLFLQNLWWPMKGRLDGLHPEYEILDWRGRPYYADFALPISRWLRIVIEIKGYNPHVRDMDRTKYCDENKRELFLQAIGFRVVNLAYDDVEQRPEQLTSLLKLFLSQFEAEARATNWRFLVEKEVLRMAMASVEPLRPIDVEKHLDVNHRTAVQLLGSLCEKGFMGAIKGASGARAVGYEVRRDYWH